MPAAFHANVIFEVGGRLLWFEGGWVSALVLSVVMVFEGLAERCSDLRKAELASAGTSGSRERSSDWLRCNSTMNCRDGTCSYFTLLKESREFSQTIVKIFGSEIVPNIQDTTLAIPS